MNESLLGWRTRSTDSLKSECYTIEEKARTLPSLRPHNPDATLPAVCRITGLRHYSQPSSQSRNYLYFEFTTSGDVVFFAQMALSINTPMPPTQKGTFSPHPVVRDGDKLGAPLPVSFVFIKIKVCRNII